MTKKKTPPTNSPDATANELKKAPQDGDTPATIQSLKPSIKKSVEAFVCEVDALADTIPLVMPLVSLSMAEVTKEFNAFLDGRCQKLGNGTFSIPPDEYIEFSNFQRRLQRNKRALQIIPRSFLTSLVSHYDAFIGSLLRAVFYMKPEVLNSSENHVTFKDLMTFASLDAARESVIEKEVEAVLRESHPDQFKWMESRFNVPLTKDLPSWPTFVEVTERRNLFVHCNGVVSAQYLSVCKRHGVDCSNVKLGEELHVSGKYFKVAYSTIIEVGAKLAHVLWRRLKPEEMDDADASLNNLCLDLIRDEKYTVAQTLLDFAARYKSFGSESGRKIFILNQAQAYKWAGKEKRALEILSGEDWDASNEKFQLGAAVLRDDFKNASVIMRHIGPDSSPAKGDYKEWPMFKTFRATSEFASAYKDVFGEPFGSVTTDELPAKTDIKAELLQ